MTQHTELAQNSRDNLTKPLQPVWHWLGIDILEHCLPRLWSQKNFVHA